MFSTKKALWKIYLDWCLKLSVAQFWLIVPVRLAIRTKFFFFLFLSNILPPLPRLVT